MTNEKFSCYVLLTRRDADDCKIKIHSVYKTLEGAKNAIKDLHSYYTGPEFDTVWLRTLEDGVHYETVVSMNEMIDVDPRKRVVMTYFIQQKPFYEELP